MAKSRQLRQHEPDPVTSLSAYCQLGEGTVVGAWRPIILSLKEAVKILLRHDLNALPIGEQVISQHAYHRNPPSASKVDAHVYLILGGLKQQFNGRLQHGCSGWCS